MNYQNSFQSQSTTTYEQTSLQELPGVINSKIYQPIDDQLNFFDLSNYQQVKLIGSSNHRVYLYQTTGDGNPIEVAVKSMTSPNDVQELEDLHSALLNIYKIQSTNHKNVIQIYGFCKTVQQQFNGNTQNLYLIAMEYIPYTLNQRIEQIRLSKIPAPLEEFENALYNLTDAAAYFQNLGQCHSDLKPENILIDSCTNPTIFKVCDLDNLQQFSKGTRYQYYNITTFVYQAPEIKEAINQGIDQIKFNAFKADVYSMGLCLVQLHHKASILDSDFGTRLWLSSVNKDLEQEYGTRLSILMNKILEFNNHSRPDFITIAKILHQEYTMDQSSLRKNLYESLMKMSSQIQIKRQASYLNMDSRCTIDMNDMVFDNKKYYTNNIASFKTQKTLSSNISPNNSNHQTPRQTQPILSTFGKVQQQQQQQLKKQQKCPLPLDLNLQCSIEEVLGDQEDSTIKAYSSKKYKSLSPNKTAKQSQFAKQHLNQILAFEDGVKVGQSQILEDCHSYESTPINKLYNDENSYKGMTLSTTIELQPDLQEVIENLSISYTLNQMY